MPKGMRSSVSLPALGRSQSSNAEEAAIAFRQTYVGSACVARAAKADHLKTIQAAHAKGHLPVLRNALAQARDTGLGSRMVVQDSSKEMSEAQKWMIICENGFRKFDVGGVGKMIKAAEELDKLSFGPGIWRDPMHPKLKKVQAIRPYFKTLGHLQRRHAKGVREFSEAWATAVETRKLTCELETLTAKWFGTLPNAREEFMDFISQDEVRLFFRDVAYDKDLMADLVCDRLLSFGVDTDRLHVRASRDGPTEGDEETPGDCLVVLTGAEAMLARVRRLHAGVGEPQLDAKAGALETESAREERVARLLELSGLQDSPEDAQPEAAEDDNIISTPRASQRRNSQPDPAPPTRATLSWKLAQQSKREERRQLENKRREEQAKQVGVVADMASLKRLLVRMFGSLHTAWRHCLDADGNGRISFAEFCQALRSIGRKQHFKSIWAEMDKDESGFVTLDEFDAQVVETMAAFDELVQERCGSFAAAWREFDADGNGLLTESEFVERCQVLGYQGNPQKLFKHLLPTRGAKYIRMSDFAPELYEEEQQAVDPYADLSNRERVELKKKETKSRFMQNMDLPFLKRMLVDNFGSLSAAWKHGLDTDGNQKVTFIEFSRAVRSIGFTGNIKAIWAELNDDGNNQISLEELDPAAHAVLSRFEDHVRATYGGHLEAWRQLGVSTTARLDKAKFIKLCEDMGVPGNAQEVYQYLPLEPGKTSLTLADLDARALQEGHLDAHRSLTQRQRVQEKKLAESSLDVAATDTAGFKKLLLLRFETMTAAWKHCLDRRGNGRATYIELAYAARELGYKGNIKDLWVELESGGEGFIVLDDLDKPAAQALRGFRELLLKRHSSYIEAWHFLDSKGKRRVDASTFAEKCKDLGYPGDPKELFRYLLDDPSDDAITLEDIDPETERESCLDPFDVQRNKKDEYESQQESLKRRGLYVEDVPALLRLLVRKYGSLAFAWKRCLDIHGNGRVGFAEFCRAMNQLGLPGHYKNFWATLDYDRNQFITLGELDPKAHRALQAFRECLLKTHGTYLAAWRALDTSKKHRLTEEDLAKQCKALGYTGDPHELFLYLIPRPGASFITLEDIDVQSDIEARVEAEDIDGDADESPRNMVDNIPALRTLLIRQFGTLPAAWKHCLDPGRNGLIGFVGFCRAMRQVGVVSGLRRLWSELEKDDEGHVTLHAFDTEAHDALTQFRDLVLDRHGGFLLAWQSFDRNGNRSLDQDEFKLACADLGYDGDVERLFRWLLDEPCFDRLTLEDLDPRAALEVEAESETFGQTGSLKKRALEKQAEQERALRKGVSDRLGWQAVLLNRHGTLTSAWKHALDLNEDGRTSYPELCQSLRSVGFRGNIRDLWNELDKDENGYISLQEFDPDSHFALERFAELVRGRFRNFTRAWNLLFDPMGNGRVDLEDFTRSCEVLGYDGDIERLFQCLLDRPLENSRWLTLDDVEPHHLKIRGRAAERALQRELELEGL